MTCRRRCPEDDARALSDALKVNSAELVSRTPGNCNDWILSGVWSLAAVRPAVVPLIAVAVTVAACAIVSFVDVRNNARMSC